MPNLVFSSLPNPAISHCINQNELVHSKLLPKHQNTPSQIWAWWDKDLAKCTSQGYDNGKGESRGIWRIKGWRLWMSQFCFSLRFLSQNYLWQLSTFYGYKGIYSSVMRNMKSQFQPNRVVWRLTSRLEQVMSFSRELTALPYWKFCLVYPPASVTLQLSLHASHMCHFGDLPVARSSHETPLNCTLLEISSHSLTHYPYIIPT